MYCPNCPEADSNNTSAISELDALSNVITTYEAILRLAESEDLNNLSLRVFVHDHCSNPSDYKNELFWQYIGLQRQYNSILAAHADIKNRRAYIIDTFDKCRWKDKWKLQCAYSFLDVVEIDIEKRIAEDSQPNSKDTSEKQRTTFLIGETSQYRFYYHDGAFLRQELLSGVFVYFGRGSSIAVVFHGWLYWFRDTGITGDKYIYRISVDGRQNEKLDWLSNKKIDFLGHWASEDVVKKIEAYDDILVVSVFRRTGMRNSYWIFVTDHNGQTCINKIRCDDPDYARGEMPLVLSEPISELLNRRLVRVFDYMMSIKKWRCCARKRIPYVDKDISTLISQIKSDTSVREYCSINCDSVAYYFGQLLGVFLGVGAALSYLSYEEPVLHNLYRSLLNANAKINGTVVGGIDYLAIRLSGNRSCEDYKAIENAFVEVEEKIGTEFDIWFEDNCMESSAYLIEETNRVFVQVVKLGFVLGEFFISQFQKIANSPNTAVTNPHNEINPGEKCLDIKYCWNCGTKLHASANYCSRCGAKT